MAHLVTEPANTPLATITLTRYRNEETGEIETSTDIETHKEDESYPTLAECLQSIGTGAQALISLYFNEANGL